MNLTLSMSLETELEAIQTGAAIYPLTDRAFLRITGPDATRWLNGMVTNNIKDLAPGQGNYNFLLNAQGRIQGTCTIYREPTEGDASYVLETDNTQLETIHQLLDKFIIMDDVELTSTLRIGKYDWNSAAGMALIGERASQLLPKLFSAENEGKMEVPPISGTLAYGMVNGTDVAIFATPNETVRRYDIWFPGEKEMYLERDIMQHYGIVDLRNEAQEAHRILTAQPKFGQDIRDRDLPQETAQTHALHFAKGCYLGQEIVERIHSRGQVHRTFTQFTLTGQLPQLPAPLESNGKPAGELTSAADIPGHGLIALGYLRREFATHPLTYPGGTATPR